MAVSRFRLARQVIADLEEISDYLSRQSSSAADRVIDELFRAFDALAIDPALGMNLGDARPDLRLFLPSKPAANYLVFYYIIPDGVMISAVIHAARDWMGMFARGERQ